MSLYADYLKEKTDDSILETDKGFASYRFIEKSVYIVDLYIVPEFRKSGSASAIADTICNLAREKGCNKLLGSIVPSNKNSTLSLKVLLGYGMTLKSSSQDFIVFEKDI